MRARMTAGFVLVLAPYLLVMSALVPAVANRGTELREKELIGWITQHVSRTMARPDWRVRLSEIMAAHVPEESRFALLIVDRNQRLVLRSPGPGPAWPRVGGDRGAVTCGGQGHRRRQARRAEQPPCARERIDCRCGGLNRSPRGTPGGSRGRTPPR
jgi:hypothetical protein